MASMYENFYNWFWAEYFWLPSHMSWKILKANKNSTAAQFGDIYFCIPVAVLLIILRIIFERHIAGPFVKYLGVQDKKPAKYIPSPICEKVYRITKKPTDDKVKELSEELGWSTREVERWFRRRHAKSIPSPLKKATESSWRFIFYFSATAYGYYILCKEKWLWDLKLFFTGLENHVISVELYIYYIVELGMYISLSISQFRDVQRKDFWQQTIHHISTILLMLFSFTTGFFRIGAVIVLLHDISDIFLESAKVFHYAKLQRICDILFAVFALTFFITRLYILPFCIFYPYFFNNMTFFADFPVWRMMRTPVVVLQILHIYWAYCISKIVIKAVTGQGVKDIRSDQEYVSEAEENSKPGSNGIPEEIKNK